MDWPLCNKNIDSRVDYPPVLSYQVLVERKSSIQGILAPAVEPQMSLVARCCNGVDLENG